MASKISQEVWINAPRQEVWDKALADFGNIYEWNPNVPKSYSTNDIASGIGAERHCDLLPLGSIEERVNKWKDGHMMEILITQGKGLPPFKDKPVATIELEDKDGGTLMRMTMAYKLGMGPVGSAMDRMMANPTFTNNIRKLVVGMKQYVETGVASEKGEGLDLSLAVAV